MVGIDFLSQADVLFPIYAQGCGDAPNRLGERNRCATMQNAHRLVRPRCHRHGGAKKIGPDFCHADVDGICESLPRVFAELLDRSLGAPNAHGA